MLGAWGPARDFRRQALQYIDVVERFLVEGS